VLCIQLTSPVSWLTRFFPSPCWSNRDQQFCSEASTQSEFPNIWHVLSSEDWKSTKPCFPINNKLLSSLHRTWRHPGVEMQSHWLLSLSLDGGAVSHLCQRENQKQVSPLVRPTLFEKACTGSGVFIYECIYLFIYCAVGAATRYWLDGGARFSAPVQTGPGAHSTAWKVGTGSLSR
jgi:hypothetical protein